MGWAACFIVRVAALAVLLAGKLSSVPLCGTGHPSTRDIVSCTRHLASKVIPNYWLGVVLRRLSRAAFAASEALLAISRLRSGVSFLARALPPMRANSATVKGFFIPTVYHDHPHHQRAPFSFKEPKRDKCSQQ